MNETVYGKHGVYVSSPGEFLRGEGGRGTGPVVVLRNIEVNLAKCECEDHRHLPAGPEPTIPALSPLCRMVESGARDLTWNENERLWRLTNEASK
jgi:hypothetical protein